MTKRYLQSAIHSDRKDPLILSTVTPLIVGSEIVDSYLCPHCDTELIVGCSLQRLMNFRLKCPQCKNISRVMRLRKGGLLGGARSVVPQHGTFRCSAPIEMKGDFTSLSGETAVAKRDRELGRNQEPGNLLLEPNSMRDLLDGLRPFFGKNLGAIKDTRFRSSVLEVENYIVSHKQGKSSQLKLIHLLELQLLSSALKRWQKYHNFDKIIADYKHDYLHATCMTTTASILADQGNDLEITLEKQGQRTPDLTLAPTWNTRVATEIKTPLPLRQGKTISEKEAKDIIDKAFKSAGTQEGGQLSPDHQGILIIGSLSRSSDGTSSINPLLKVDITPNPEYDQQEFVRLVD